MVSLTVFFIAITTFLTYEGQTLDIDDRKWFIHRSLNYVKAAQCIDFALLTISISVLQYFLGKQGRIQGQSDAFQSERCYLITILIVFDLTFIGRFIFAYYYWDMDFKKVYTVMMSILSGLVFDVIPICLILLIHSRNHRDSNEAI